MYDLCVIGGGVSGVCAAVAGARLGLKVKIFEKNSKPVRKLYATGNGRCNITNRNMELSEKYNSSSPRYHDFLHAVLGANPDRQVDEFLCSIGIPTYTNQDGYVYPASGQASAVAWALLDEAKRLDVDIECKTEITDIKRTDRGFDIRYKDGHLSAAQVVLACGGCSYASLGGGESGFSLAAALGHHTISLRPALCGLVIEEDISVLSGVRIPARASLIDGTGTALCTETGELQFTDYGLSGIMIFNMSSTAGRLLSEGKRLWLKIDMLPHTRLWEQAQIYEMYGTRTVVGMLNGFINDKLSSYLAKRAGLLPKAVVAETDADRLKTIFDMLHGYTTEIRSVRDYDSAQISAGGISIDEIAPHTCESLLVPGLYLTGEMLDVDGLCGGYNLTFAILSGIKAGASAYDKN